MPSNEIDTYLYFEPTGRQVEPSLRALVDEFTAMRTEHTGDKPAPDYATKFRGIGRSSGTHLLKLTGLTASAASCQIAISVRAPGANSEPKLFPGNGAGEIGYAKILFRPIEMANATPKGIVDHVREPEEHTALILEAFREVFGEEALEAVKASLSEGPEDILSIPRKTFPVTYIPHPDGGSLQVSPVMPAEGFQDMQKVCRGFFHKVTKDNPSPRRGRIERSIVTGKMRNISGCVGGSIYRFHGTPPKLLSIQDAELYRYAKGGAFPRIPSNPLSHFIDNYLDQLTKAERYDNLDMAHGRDRTADAIISIAQDFLLNVQAAVLELEDVDAVPEAPSIPSLIMGAFWPSSEKRIAVKAAIRGPQFQKRLKIAGE